MPSDRELRVQPLSDHAVIYRHCRQRQLHSALLPDQERTLYFRRYDRLHPACAAQQTTRENVRSTERTRNI
jgi:hypothetical protein